MASLTRKQFLQAGIAAALTAEAAAAAAAALPAWSAMSGPARGNFLFKAADILDKKFEQVAADMTREEGKTLPEAKGEVRRAINILRYFAGEGSRMPGMLVPSERDRVHMFALRKPIGVVGLITPWNFPSAIPAWKLAPALVCGNTVLMKPASAAPLSAWRIVEALHEAGIPKGVVNFVAGSGGTLGQALVDAAPLKAVSFTGSCEIGQWLHQKASERHLRIQRAKEFLRMGDIADPVHIRIFSLHRSLSLRDFRQVGHEPLNETFEESHHDDDRHRREASDEQTDVRQIPIDIKRIGIFRGGMGGHGESSEHPRMTIANFFAKILQDDRAGFLRTD